MRTLSKRVLLIGLALALIVIVPTIAWLSLTHQPHFYREMMTVALPGPQRTEEAKHFLSQSIQLSNDICNEPTWEAVFTDHEVNAWLAEDLVKHFADQLPPGVSDPRVVFEADRVTLAFRLDQGPFQSVVWVVVRPRVPEDNVLELTLEKVRAGVLPIPADKFLDRIVERAHGRGLKVEWKRVDDLPVVFIRYTPDATRDDVRLEHLHIQSGQVQISGRSNPAKGVVRRPTLPTRKVLQLNFPKRKVHDKGVSSVLRSSTGPTS